jgi:hypothetical protein
MENSLYDNLPTLIVLNVLTLLIGTQKEANNPTVSKDAVFRAVM